MDNNNFTSADFIDSIFRDVLESENSATLDEVRPAENFLSVRAFQTKI